MATVRLASTSSPPRSSCSVSDVERDWVRALQRPDALCGTGCSRRGSRSPVHAVEKPLAPPTVTCRPAASSAIRARRSPFSTARSATTRRAPAASTSRRPRPSQSTTSSATPPPRSRPARACRGLEPRRRRGGVPDRARRHPRRRGKPAVHKVRHEFATPSTAGCLPRGRHDTVPRVLPARDHERPDARHPRGAGSAAGSPLVRRPEPPEVCTSSRHGRGTRDTPRPRRQGRRPGTPAARLRPTALRTGAAAAPRYIDRPWYSSGDDELLGIVLEHQPWRPGPSTSRRGLRQARRESVR